MEFSLCTLTPEVQCLTFHQNHMVWQTKKKKKLWNGNDSKQPYWHYFLTTGVCINFILLIFSYQDIMTFNHRGWWSQHSSRVYFDLNWNVTFIKTNLLYTIEENHVKIWFSVNTECQRPGVILNLISLFNFCWWISNKLICDAV